MSYLKYFVFILVSFQLYGSDISNNKKVVITSFYPIQIMALNLLKGIKDIDVISIAKEETGCLHNYQLTPNDLKKIDQASALLINGAGMEPFIEKIKNRYKNLPIIDSSEGIKLKKMGVSHNHQNHHHDGHHKTEKDREMEYNPHLWPSIQNAIKQTEN